MVIIGAGGFAREVLQVLIGNRSVKNIAFYDDVTPNSSSFVFDTFPVLKSPEELQQFFSSNGNEFVLGLGNSFLREKMLKKINDFGGELVSAIDSKASIGQFCKLDEGATILAHSCLSNGSIIGKAPLIYYNSIVTHDCVIGDFVELSPGATLLGHVHVGSYTQIGANATVLNRIQIGDNCIIGAGAVVTKNVPSHTVVAGVPARVIKKLDLNQI